MHKYNYDLVILLTSSLYKTIDVGKNEFRCLFRTLYRSLRISTKQLPIMLNFLSHRLIARKHMRLTKLFEKKKTTKKHRLRTYEIINSRYLIID